MLIEPINNPLGVSPSKGNQGITRGKEKIFWPRWESTRDLRIRSTVTLQTDLRATRWVWSTVTLQTDLRATRSVWGRGLDSHRDQKLFSLPRVVPWLPLLGLTPSRLFMGSISTLIDFRVNYLFTICVHSATRHNIHMYPYFFSLRRDLSPKSSPTFSVLWVIHGFYWHFNLHFRVNSPFTTFLV